jgi:hypothetical protein
MKNLLSPTVSAVRVAEHPSWQTLKNAVESIRSMQLKDGSIDPGPPGATVIGAARAELDRITTALGDLVPHLPHDAEYLAAAAADLRRWADEGFGVPDFLDSLLAFRPTTAERRADGVEHLVVFPMYTQNGNPDRNLEAVLFRVVWPDWLAELERTRFDNPAFVPIAFEDFTPGYDTNSAVLFPETVAVREAPADYGWGAIFCDREAARFRTVVSAAVDVLGLELPEPARKLITEQSTAQSVFVLWDLIHDRTHSHGDLPFDPFMIKQRSPFWMYALEELRCDLTAFRAAVDLQREGFELGRDIQYAVLFDRMLRFPITGDRVRNYDGLGGQLLFAYLHQHDALRWTDNRLAIDWKAAAQHAAELGRAIDLLYRKSIDRPKVAHWLAAYQLIAEYLTPHPASRWAKGPEALPLEEPARKLVDTVLPDEFPLSMFYEALQRKLKGVIASTRGITAASAATAEQHRQEQEGEPA